MAYESGWRSDKKSGEIGWSNNWVSGQYFQQLKGKGKVNDSYASRYAELKNSGSDVDDYGEGWKTLHQMKTKGATATMQKLAKEWQAAGYDVRVQDLEGVDGVKKADLAVRPGSGTDGDGEEDKPIEMSERLATARARAAQFEEDRVSGQFAKDLYDSGNHSAEGFLERYKLKLGERLESGRFRDPDHNATNSSKVASGQNDVSVDTSEFARTGRDNREQY